MSEQRTRLSWSWVCGYRFEAICLLVVVMLLAACSASAIAYGVNQLFEPINRVFSQVLGV